MARRASAPRGRRQLSQVPKCCRRRGERRRTRFTRAMDSSRSEPSSRDPASSTNDFIGPTSRSSTRSGTSCGARRGDSGGVPVEPGGEVAHARTGARPSRQDRHATAGQGGGRRWRRGMKRVDDSQELPALDCAAAEGRSGVRRCARVPGALRDAGRHIEVQVLGDGADA